MKGFPLEFGMMVSAQGVPNASMMGLPDGRKCFKIGLVVLIQYLKKYFLKYLIGGAASTLDIPCR